MPAYFPPPNLAGAVDSAAGANIIPARFPVTGPVTTPNYYRPPPVRPGTPGTPVRPVSPRTVRPNYPQIPYGQQTPAERMQGAMDAREEMLRNSEVEADPNGDYLTVTAIDINTKRRRRRNCCNPALFLTEWLRSGNSIANKRDPRLNFTPQDFTVVPRSRVFTIRGFNYQYFVTGTDLEYEATGGGARQWADGEESARCWLVEAKYHFSMRSSLRATGMSGPDIDRYMEQFSPLAPRNILPDTPPPAADDGPSVRALPEPPPPPGEDAQFRRYGLVINNPDPPAQECWNLGLRVVVSQRGGILHMYADKMIRYSIPGRVEWRRPPGEYDGTTMEEMMDSLPGGNQEGGPANE